MKKERKIKGHYTLVDTFNATERYTFEYYKEWCEMNDIECSDEESQDYYIWAEEQAREELDDFFENLKYEQNLKYVPVIVEGSLGLWWGNPDIEQQYFGDVIKAIKACIEGAYDVIIKKKGHRLEVVNLHHDGRNYFTLTFLNTTGECRYHEHGKVSTKNMENVHKLPTYLF